MEIALESGKKTIGLWSTPLIKFSSLKDKQNRRCSAAPVLHTSVTSPRALPIDRESASLFWLGYGGQGHRLVLPSDDGLLFVSSLLDSRFINFLRISSGSGSRGSRNANNARSYQLKGLREIAKLAIIRVMRVASYCATTGRSWKSFSRRRLFVEATNQKNATR